MLSGQLYVLDAWRFKAVKGLVTMYRIDCLSVHFFYAQQKKD